MLARGRRLFTLAAGALLLVAALHTLGTASPPPDNAATRDLLAAMRGYTLDTGLGMVPSAYDVQKGLAYTMAVLLVFLGAVNLLLAARGPQTLIRPAAALNALCCAVLTALYLVFPIAPPMVCFAVLMVLFTAAALTAGGAAGVR